MIVEWYHHHRQLLLQLQQQRWRRRRTTRSSNSNDHDVSTSLDCKNERSKRTTNEWINKWRETWRKYERKRRKSTRARRETSAWIKLPSLYYSLSLNERKKAKWQQQSTVMVHFTLVMQMQRNKQQQKSWNVGKERDHLFLTCPVHAFRMILIHLTEIPTKGKPRESCLKRSQIGVPWSAACYGINSIRR